MTLLSLALALSCSRGFNDKNGNPNGTDDTGSETDADADADADTDTDADADADTDTDTDTDTGPDPDDVDDDGDGVTENEGDCDDTDSSVGPDEEETPYNGVDDDCDEGTPDDDLDGDGYGVDEDCDDENKDANPGAEEDHTDGVDNDCDDDVDERFDVETVDSSCDCGAPSSVAIDSLDEAHILYRDNDNFTVRYIRLNTDGSWSTAKEIVPDSSTGEWLDAEVDSSDQVQLAYTYYDGYGTQLAFAYREAGGTWYGNYEVDGYSSDRYDVGYYVDLEIDSANLPSFAYFDNEDQEPMLADYTTFGVAVYTDVDINYLGINPTGYYTALALDSRGYDHVAFWQNGALYNEVQYAVPLDATFSDTIYGDPGGYLALEMKSDDTPCVAFQELTTADLMYGCLESGTWNVETVDSSGSMGTTLDLAFNSADEPWIAYYAESSGNLKAAVYESGAWSTTQVDVDGDVGAYPSIAIDSSDQVIISYYDVSNGTLKVAFGD